MMMTPISPRDWEALSAYLDNQLGPKDRAQLETRLGANPDLRAALDDLRRTRAILRSQPRLRAPRNFTLTPAMVGGHRRSRPLPVAYPMLRLASALATIFFVVLFIGNLALRNFAPQSMQVALAPQAEARPAAPAVGMGGGGGGAAFEQALPTETATDMAIAPAAAPLEPAVAMMPTAEAVLEAARPAAASEMPQAKALQATPLAPDAISTATEAGVEENALKKAEDRQLPEPEGAPPGVEPAARAETGRRTILSVASILLWLQILLALVAICAGLAALYLRRSMRD
jgi:anti-sigma factor RsiW